MRILIYCDIDGVLHPWPCPSAQMFDISCFMRLVSAIAPYDAGIVVTSTWRIEWSLNQIRKRIGPLGDYVVGVTPEIDDPFIKHGRYHEVLRHREQYALSESDWVAIDDEPGRYPNDLENLILTNPRVGFSEDDAALLTRLLSQL
mgnify:CR=1 FL=1